MSFLQRVIQCMERIAPLHFAERSWDNVGLLAQAPKPRSSSNVLLTIDLTPAVVKEALDKDISVVIAYHPVIFRPLKSLTMDDPKTAGVLELVASGVSVYSPHTALDAINGGMNDWLIDACGQGQTSVIVPSATSENDGMGRLRLLSKPHSFREIVDDVKKHTGLKTVRYALAYGQTLDSKCCSVAVCVGSGSSVLNKTRADVYLTGEMSHHEVLSAIANGTSVILLEHSSSERGFLKVLQKRLASELSNAQISVSEKDVEPIQVY